MKHGQRPDDCLAESLAEEGMPDSGVHLAAGAGGGAFGVAHDVLGDVRDHSFRNAGHLGPLGTFFWTKTLSQPRLAPRVEFGLHWNFTRQQRAPEHRAARRRHRPAVHAVIADGPAPKRTALVTASADIRAMDQLSVELWPAVGLWQRAFVPAGPAVFAIRSGGVGAPAGIHAVQAVVDR